MYAVYTMWFSAMRVCAIPWQPKYKMMRWSHWLHIHNHFSVSPVAIWSLYCLGCWLIAAPLLFTVAELIPVLLPNPSGFCKPASGEHSLQSSYPVLSSLLLALVFKCSEYFPSFSFQLILIVYRGILACKAAHIVQNTSYQDIDCISWIVFI